MILQNIYTVLGDNERPMTTCDDLRKFDFPVLLMTGERSPKKFAFFYDEMRKCRNFSPTLVIPNAVHNIHRSNQAAYDKAVLEFISAAC